MSGWIYHFGIGPTRLKRVKNIAIESRETSKLSKNDSLLRQRLFRLNREINRKGFVRGISVCTNLASNKNEIRISRVDRIDNSLPYLEGY